MCSDAGCRALIYLNTGFKRIRRRRGHPRRRGYSCLNTFSKRISLRVALWSNNITFLHRCKRRHARGYSGCWWRSNNGFQQVGAGALGRQERRDLFNHLFNIVDCFANQVVIDPLVRRVLNAERVHVVTCYRRFTTKERRRVGHLVKRTLREFTLCRGLLHIKINHIANGRPCAFYAGAFTRSVTYERICRHKTRA